MSYGKSKSAETRVTPIMQAGARGPFRGVNGAGKASERPGRTWQVGAVWPPQRRRGWVRRGGQQRSPTPGDGSPGRIAQPGCWP